jgi:hypothetical protein
MIFPTMSKTAKFGKKIQGILGVSFAPLVVVGTNGIVFFTLYSCIDQSICPIFVCC